MPQITYQRVFDVLESFDLLASPSELESAASANDPALTRDADDVYAAFDAVTYASNAVTPSSLLICKGAFKDAYMSDAASRGLTCYIADHKFDSEVAGDATAIIVTDTRKALAVIAQEFYGHPDRELVTIGITGTKGKSTTTFFTHAILNNYFAGKTALISSVSNCTDGKTLTESNLTTPESLDLFRMLREAVDNGLTHAVIEVSSQAYKVDRVFNVHFSIGAFLNISPDHISPIEHPTFDDYFACKREIIKNSDVMVFGENIDYRDVINADVAAAGVPAYFVRATSVDRNRIHLAMPGEFNYDNVAAAIMIAQLAGVPADSASIETVNTVTIPGRMEVFHGTHDNDSNVVAVVDFAHNGISTSTLLDFAETTFGSQNPYIVLVTGSAGNKAINRRVEIVHAAQDRVQRLIFTADDTDTESVESICETMDNAVTNPHVEHGIILDRATAVETALTDAIEYSQAHAVPAVVLLIGKGNEHWIKVHNKHVDYEGDDAITSRILGR